MKPKILVDDKKTEITHVYHLFDKHIKNLNNNLIA